MKPNLILTMGAAAVILLQSASATVTLPEFKSRKEVRVIRAEQAAVRKLSVQPEQQRLQASAFYTGKAIDSETGLYLFKYRNYDPGTSRWKALDPSGFPDGANNLLYVNNQVLVSIDFQGLDIVHVNDSSAVGGAGHSGSYIGNSNDGYTYHSYGDKFSGSGASYDTANGQTFGSLDDAMNHASSLGYDRYQGWNSTPQQDTAARDAFTAFSQEGYNVTTHNCLGAVQAALEAAEISYNGGTSYVPNQFFGLNMPPYSENDFSGEITAIE